MADLVLLSPLEGWAATLEEVPDPVFAGRMLGDGLAIDPVGHVLHAPCSGEVVSLHHAGHAATIRSPEGAEVLMHIGLETVALGGRGFTAHVRQGQGVKAGDPLIGFDLDVLARGAKSLISPVLVIDGKRFEIAWRTQGRLVTVGEPLIGLRALDAAPEAASAGPGAFAGRRLRVPLAHGVHARPAAAIAAAAGAFAADIRLAQGDRRANAKSPVALLALGVRHGDEVAIEATGADAEAAAAALERLILHGIDESAEPEAVAPTAAAARSSGTAVRLRGVTASPGIAIGVAARLHEPEIVVDAAAGTPEEQADRLQAALGQVRADTARLAAAVPAGQKAILEAHLAFLDDPELIADARARIAAGSSAGVAWKEAVDGCIALIRKAEDARIAERVDDLVDLQRRVLLALGGHAVSERPTLPQDAILLAEDLLPSQLMSLDAGRLAGVCTAKGGPTSHVAIIAAAMNLPALVAAGPGVLAVVEGTRVVLDADRGVLDVAPDAQALAAAERTITAARSRRRAARAKAQEPCVTADGQRIEVLANLGSIADAAAAVAAGAEGCGLLRTEFLFLDRADAPDEDEQAACYQAIADALQGRPLTLRTLDVGGDKAAPYLALPQEENPALGLRGVRVSLARPALLEAQLRAMLRVRAPQPLRIMLPMVSSLEEFMAVRALVDRLGSDLPSAAEARFGIMVETPAAAVTADLLCEQAEFVSLGTNDLSQYVLAMDRGNPAVASSVDALHPAVLRLIGSTVEGARARGRPVGVCGGLASDLAAAPILLGLGASSLSAAPEVVPELKALIRGLSLAGCQALARQALALRSPAEVRALAAAGPETVA